MNTEKNEDNEAEINLGSEDNDLGLADHKQDEGWHNTLDEDKDNEDKDAEMDNDTSDNESNNNDNNNNDDDDDNDDNKSSDSQSSNDSMDNSSKNSTRTPPAENKETTQSIQGIKVKAMISATSGQGYTNDRMHIDYQENTTGIFSKNMAKSSKKAG
jgi:hypothetical protein